MGGGGVAVRVSWEEVLSMYAVLCSISALENNVNKLAIN